MNTAFLCLGGNLGNRLESIKKALDAISTNIGEIKAQAPIYETQAWGSKSKNNFLNTCIKINTALSPEDLMKKLLGIEKKLGRKRGRIQNSDRLIDIDILYYNNAIINTKNLQIPHPRLALRKFVLVPLNDIAPSIKHPILLKKTTQLLTACKDDLVVTAFAKNKPKLICIEGNIGSGKTTLAEALAKKLNATFIAEEFKNNPLLPLFYTNNKKYAFALETSFLINRFNTLFYALKNTNKPIVCDYSFYKCLWFAKTNLKGENLKHFKRIFKTLQTELPEPDLIVYLKTTNIHLKNNIKKRGRAYETAINTGYLNKIETNYQTGLNKLKHIPQLQIQIKLYDKKNTHKIIQNILEHI